MVGKDLVYTNTLAECLLYPWNKEFCEEEISNAGKYKKLDIVIKVAVNSSEDQEIAQIYYLTRHQLMLLEEDFDKEKVLQGLNKIKGEYGRKFEKYLLSGKLKNGPSLGFHPWDDDLILIPLWATTVLPDDMKVISITGDTSTIGKCDKDVRYGCIAYGFLKGEEK